MGSEYLLVSSKQKKFPTPHSLLHVSIVNWPSSQGNRTEKSAVGSSSTLWYIARYGCASASSTVIRFSGVNCRLVLVLVLVFGSVRFRLICWLFLGLNLQHFFEKISGKCVGFWEFFGDPVGVWVVWQRLDKLVGLLVYCM